MSELGFAPTALSEQECCEVLERQGLGRLACYSPSQDESYIVPVAYMHHPGAIYLALVPGQKLRYLDEHPHGVCLEVEEVDANEDWKTVIVTGDFSRVQPGQEPAGKPVRGSLASVFEIGLAPYASDAKVLCRIDIRRLTGRHDRWITPPLPQSDR